ncbi:selT-like protein [Vigna radiata var. radiata]|uniref:SelT-like protein n=1 Tax=Vigna radiata var. radiata TaxID=3916 RepID=A0A1S3U9N5_VIGRR|nr:selT-like protein [Vigna radiata var. radiata]
METLPYSIPSTKLHSLHIYTGASRIRSSRLPFRPTRFSTKPLYSPKFFILPRHRLRCVAESSDNHHHSHHHDHHDHHGHHHHHDHHGHHHHHHHHHHHPPHHHHHPPHHHHHPPHHHHHPPHLHHDPPQHHYQPITIELPPEKTTSSIANAGLGNTVNINFCSSCSYRGTAVTMKNMLDIAFPGTEVILANYPPSLPKRLLSKLIPVVQIGVIGVVVAGEHIFPVLGFAAPPPWYFNLRANKFGTIASTWLLGNALQSFLQSSGAFEIYFNGELVFSKLKEGRFPGEIELKDLITKRMTSSIRVNGVSELMS